jgi:hypothetical protein
MSERFIEVQISPDGKQMKVEAEGFHGVGCTALLEAFDNMGEVVEQHTKPEYDEVNHNFHGNYARS